MTRSQLQDLNANICMTDITPAVYSTQTAREFLRTKELLWCALTLIIVVVVTHSLRSVRARTDTTSRLYVQTKQCITVDLEQSGNTLSIWRHGRLV